ncbi:MAG TPA: GDP-mannose 4,6-dehydratase [Vicinamibacterales bacterium]|jgi:GDP-4-dehydro-6-deoxy-D-mannose reductase|nr:GDP-mannose 4,6-dehydratase [Vicinamibacterales bacterium]
MSTVIVTGASGFAGSHLVDSLVADAVPVVAWHRPGREPAPAIVKGVTWRAVDLLDREAVKLAIAESRPSILFHCAGAAHVGRSWETSEPTFAINVKGTQHLVDALSELRLSTKVLIPSSATVYATSTEALTEEHPIRPSSPYALSKLAQEMVGTDGVASPQVFIARAFNHFGPRQDPWFVASGFARRIADIEAGRWEPEITAGNLDTCRDLTDVRDTVKAYRIIVQNGRPARPYNVCSGRTVVIRSLLEQMLAKAKVPIQVRTDPARYRPHDQPIVLGNPQRISHELGWKAEIPLGQTVDDLLSYWRTRSSAA